MSRVRKFPHMLEIIPIASNTTLFSNCPELPTHIRNYLHVSMFEIIRIACNSTLSSDCSELPAHVQNYPHMSRNIRTCTNVGNSGRSSLNLKLILFRVFSSPLVLTTTRPYLFSADEKFQNLLRKVYLSTVERSECEKKLRTTKLGKHFSLHKSFICAIGENGDDTCKVSGSQLRDTGVQIA